MLQNNLPIIDTKEPSIVANLNETDPTIDYLKSKPNPTQTINKI